MNDQPRGDIKIETLINYDQLVSLLAKLDVSPEKAATVLRSIPEAIQNRLEDLVIDSLAVDENSELPKFRISDMTGGNGPYQLSWEEQPGLTSPQLCRDWEEAFSRGVQSGGQLYYPEITQ